MVNFHISHHVLNAKCIVVHLMNDEIKLPIYETKLRYNIIFVYKYHYIV